MKKWTFVLLLLLFLILISCSQVSEKEILVVEEPVEESVEKSNKSYSIHPALSYLAITAQGKQKHPTLVRACWYEEEEEPCEVEYDDAIDKVSEEEVFSLSPGETAVSHFYTMEYPMPNVMDVSLIMDEDVDNLELVATGIKPIELKFNVTEEKGLHYYLVRLEWNEFMHGEAYFVIKVLVR